jgi:quinol monooxygenase YgiN
MMELYMFGRFEVRTGEEEEFEQALRDVMAATRAEAGCMEAHGYRSVRKAGLYFLHSRWKDAATFDAHAALPHTLSFLEIAEHLLVKPRDVLRMERIA